MLLKKIDNPAWCIIHAESAQFCFKYIQNRKTKQTNNRKFHISIKFIFLVLLVQKEREKRKSVWHEAGVVTSSPDYMEA